MVAFLNGPVRGGYGAGGAVAVVEEDERYAFACPAGRDGCLGEDVQTEGVDFRLDEVPLRIFCDLLQDLRVACGVLRIVEVGRRGLRLDGQRRCRVVVVIDFNFISRLRPDAARVIFERTRRPFDDVAASVVGLGDDCANRPWRLYVFVVCWVIVPFASLTVWPVCSVASYV